jgi:hypothetical protein
MTVEKKKGSSYLPFQKLVHAAVEARYRGKDDDGAGFGTREVFTAVSLS